MLQHAVRYVEEGLLSLTHAQDHGGMDSAGPATALEMELRSMLGAMKVGEDRILKIIY